MQAKLLTICFIMTLVFGTLYVGLNKASAQVPESQAQMKLSFAPIVSSAAPSVVNIYAKRIVARRTVPTLFNDPLFERFFGGSLGLNFGGRGMVRERVENSLGSGVLVQGDGLIVTSSHVIRGASEIRVALMDGREFDAELVVEEERTDLAVLRIQTDEPLPYLELGDSEALQVGDLVLAIGNPFGVGQTVTSGIVSANARTNVGISDMNFFIQTDAAINPGNSGGALVDLEGRLVGINTAIFSRDGGSLGIGFAIPAIMVRTVIDAARSDGVIRRAWFGAVTQDLTSDIARSMGLERPKGAVVTSVHEGSPAAEAGLKTGDVITGVNDKEIMDTVGLKFRIATLKIGERATISYLRSGKAKTTSFETTQAPEKPARNETILEGAHPLDRLTVANINPALSEELGLMVNKEDRVIILQVPRGSYGARLGLREQDVIRAVNGDEVVSVKDLKKALNKQAQGWTIIIKRGGQTLTLRVR